MKLSEYLNTWAGAQSEVRFHRIANAGLVLLCLVACIGWLGRHEVVIVTPPPLASNASIGYNKMSDDILVQWGISITELIGNVTPSTAPYLKKTMAPMLAPNIYHAVLGALEDQVEMIKREQVTVRFSPSQAKVDQKTGHVLVTGDLTTTGVQGTSQSEMRTYDLTLAVVNYRVLLAGMDVYKGGPRNQMAE